MLGEPNNMGFEAKIGLELHVQLKTKSKMFSSAPVCFGAEPNTCVDITDAAFPGSLPTVNKTAVKYAVMLANALSMNISNTLNFERKNYFYSDLPRGYQITQHFQPLGTNGYLLINNKRIDIQELHLEEDTCKQVHIGESTFLDYNRAGIPLIEIVTSPTISSGEEASLFVEKIRSIVTFLGISDGKMEKGSLRCDVNVSINNSNKVEIKNLNSVANIQKAIDFELNRQALLLQNGDFVTQETRRFDEASNQTISMRAKGNEVDYKYFTDPNLPPIKLSKAFIEAAIKLSPELEEVRYCRYKALGQSDYDASLLTQDADISNYFDSAIACGANAKLAANWINDEIRSVLNKRQIGINEFSITPSLLTKLIKLIEEGRITNKQARDLFKQMIDNPVAPSALLPVFEQQKLDDKQLKNVINKVLDDNKQAILDYNSGKDRALGFIIGKVINETNGCVNTSLVKKLVIEEIKRR